MFKISVCLATYNGERYIEEQLSSILRQLSSSDEVIVCDDNSTDNTLLILDRLNDDRIKVISNESNLGYIKNFEKAVLNSSGDYIFLSDQDDIWPCHRLELMMSTLSVSNKKVVCGNIETFSLDVACREVFKPSLQEKHNRAGWKNVLRMLIGGIPYFGCCMLIEKKYCFKVFPLLASNISHDIQIALKSNIDNEIYHIEDTVIYRREHDTNVTDTNRTFFQKLITRLQWLNLIALILRKKHL